jgi:hypothetical protein
MSRVPSKFMNDYKTYITIEYPQRVILSNLPFPSGQKIENTIKVIDERRLALAKEMRDLFKELQTLPSSQEITEEEIAAEIDAYREPPLGE